MQHLSLRIRLSCFASNTTLRYQVPKQTPPSPSIYRFPFSYRSTSSGYLPNVERFLSFVSLFFALCKHAENRLRARLSFLPSFPSFAPTFVVARPFIGAVTLVSPSIQWRKEKEDRKTNKKKTGKTRKIHQETERALMGIPLSFFPSVYVISFSRLFVCFIRIGFRAFSWFGYSVLRSTNNRGFVKIRWRRKEKTEQRR